MEDKKKLLAIKDLEVKFRVRGRILTAIRGISLDIYENESIAIVGESGSGKSVFTKTFAGMLDENGFISNGDIIFNDEELADTVVSLKGLGLNLRNYAKNKLDSYSKYEAGAEEYNALHELEKENNEKKELSEEEKEDYERRIADLTFHRTELSNFKQTLDSNKEKDKIREVTDQIKNYDDQIKSIKAEMKEKINAHRSAILGDKEYAADYSKKESELKAAYLEKVKSYVLDDKTSERNLIIANEIYLSVGRYIRTATSVPSSKEMRLAACNSQSGSHSPRNRSQSSFCCSVTVLPYP